MTRSPAADFALFRHLTGDRAADYRAIMQAFAQARRQFVHDLRPDEIRAEAPWPQRVPEATELDGLLTSLVDWGNLQAQPDTARVGSIEDFYRKRLLYRLTAGGEAAEVGLTAFFDALARRAELQSVALEDIQALLEGLSRLAVEQPADPAKLRSTLVALVGEFDKLADNAEAFMAALARDIEVQRAGSEAVVGFKTRLIGYLERFIGDLVARSASIATLLVEIEPHIDGVLHQAAEREARDAVPEEGADFDAVVAERRGEWQARWHGFVHWFLGRDGRLSRAELLRASARAAIPRLLQAVANLNERRAGRSDRAADFRRLAVWFADCVDESDAHRLWRCAFGLSPARHLALVSPDRDAGASTAWGAAAPIELHPKLREYGVLPTRGAPPKIRDRSQARALLAARVAAETAEIERARRLLAHGRRLRLSDLGPLDAARFRLFLALLGDALAAQRAPDQAIERNSADGSLRIRLEPIDDGREACIDTPLGVFRGRDQYITISALDAEPVDG